MSIHKSLQLGLCCINNNLRKRNPPIFCSRSMIMASIEKLGIDVLKEKIIKLMKE